MTILKPQGRCCCSGSAGCTPLIIDEGGGAYSSCAGTELSLPAPTVLQGTGPVTYQWYAGPSGDTSAPLAGQDAAVLSFNPLEPGMAGEYWVQITNPCSERDSATYTVTVPTAPDSVTIDPAGGTVGVVLTAIVTGGTAPISLEWFLDGNPLGVGTGSIDTDLYGPGEYTVSATNACGEVVSEPVEVTAPVYLSEFDADEFELLDLPPYSGLTRFGASPSAPYIGDIGGSQVIWGNENRWATWWNTTNLLATGYTHFALETRVRMDNSGLLAIGLSADNDTAQHVRQLNAAMEAAQIDNGYLVWFARADNTNAGGIVYGATAGVQAALGAGFTKTITSAVYSTLRVDFYRIAATTWRVITTVNGVVVDDRTDATVGAADGSRLGITQFGTGTAANYINTITYEADTLPPPP